MIFTRKEFQAYLRIQHSGLYHMLETSAFKEVQKLEPTIDQEKYKGLQLNWEDLNTAFIGTNINRVEITVYDKITLYQSFIRKYPYISISEENFNKAYSETFTTDLDLLRDYILSQDLAEEVVP